MPKRISRKLLLGLGSIITFGTVGTVSGFGIKSIIDSTLNNSKLNQLIVNSSQTGSVTDIPNYHVADQDMFIKTKNLKQFHFGNTQIGQKITPWGWLGVFDDGSGIKSRIALTAWNGEIIWVNQDYQDKEHNVYDMQYDFNSNLLFVLRTDSTNGFYNSNSQYPKIWLEVLNAKTGEKYKDSVSDTEFKTLQEKAKDKLITQTTLLDGYDTNQNVKDKTKNLYYLDLTYSDKKQAILATWMPNYMQMARQKYGGTQEGSLPSFWDVINTWDESATSFMFDITKLGGNEKYNKKQRKFELLRSLGIEPIKDGQNKIIDAFILESQLSDTATKVNASEIYLLTNPFFTTSHDGKAFVMHLIGATATGKVYHKTIGWEIDLSDNADESGKIYSLTEGNNGLTDRKRYDNIEYWTGGGGYFDLKSDKSWTKAKGWNPAFVNANLRANKNMFDENSIVFAYPYSSSSDETNDSINGSYGENGYAMPVFNVTQIWLDKDNAQFKKNQQSSKKFHTNYDFGKQIDDYYVQNKNSYGKDDKINSIYPYPSPGSFDEHNINHSYNRLISVSPFDNTVVYAAKPNVGESIFSASNSDNKDKWAGFWLANSWAWDTNKGKKYYHPLVVVNDGTHISDADRYNANEMEYMLSNINDLYRDGFTFDISSRMDVTANGTTSLNLYFNQTGSGVNDSYENKIDGFQSSKIGLLRDVLFDAGSNKAGQPGSKGWADNITPRFRDSWNNEAKKLFATTINKDSFSSIIHSRADLKKWYPRTWSNVNFASNMLRAEEIFRIDSQGISDIPVANQFGQRLIGTAFNGGNKSIDLVSAWKDISEDNSKYNKRFERLIMKRPKIQAGLTSEPDGLGIVTKYELPKILFDSIVGKKDWEIKNNQANLTLTKVDTVKNTSKQILSAWGDSYKMKKIAFTTSDINQTSTNWKEEITVTEVLDKKDHINNPNQITFGKGNNNNITRNGVQALRLMLRIVKPSGNNLPRWIQNLSESFFNKAYPLEPAYEGETTFKDVVKAFADEKARLIDLSEANNAAVSLGNLKIDAYLELNPKFGNYTAKTDKIYSVPGGGKAIIDKQKNNQLIIYKDQFSGSRTIYDQTQISYTDFNQGGFKSIPPTSWANPNELNGLKNIKVTTDYNNLQDNLVRKTGDNTPLLTFDFKQGSTTELEITPGNLTWFTNHFKNYNRLLGLFVQFEYQTGANDKWISLIHTTKVGTTTVWTDQEITKNLADNNNRLLLSNVPNDIKKLRFKLVRNPNTSDPNEIIDIQNFQETDGKYISDEFNISVQRIIVDKNWISQQTLSNTSNSLANLEVTDVTKFEESVLAKIGNPNEKNQVQLVYEFENNKNLSAAQLVEKIKAKFNDFNNPNQGVFALWNGADGEQLIKAKFVLKNNNNNEFKLVTSTSQNPTDDDLTENVKSTIKSKIDIGDYINQLTSSSIEAKMGAQPGQVNPGSIKIPDKSGQIGQGRFHGKTFEQINQILTEKGISIKFKQWENNAWSNNWMELNRITSYAPNNPQIQMGFIFQQDKPTNLELVNNGTLINSGGVYTLKLNLPKIVKAPANDAVIKNAYNSNPFTGNTKKLIIEQAKLTTSENNVLQELIKASGNQTDYSKLEDVLIFKYQIGNSEFLEAEALKNHLSTQQDDQSSNSLKMKVEIKPPTNGKDPEFALEDGLKAREFELLEDDNKIIKKWLHGKKFEEELKANNITVTGSKTNLTYNLGGKELTAKFSSTTGKYDEQELTLQYRLLDVNNSPVNKAKNDWIDGYLPSSVQSNVNTIELRVASDASIAENDRIYVYGPEEEGNQAVARIDLSQIATLIKVDPTWFNEIAVVSSKTDINNLTLNKINTWEEKIYQKIPELATDQNLKNKLVIKYEFGRQQNLQAATLANAIKTELTNYSDSTHHGIVKLYDKADGNNSGLQIKATFEKSIPNDPSIKFINNTNASIDGEQNKDKRTGVADSSNITTTINLTEWIKHLMTSLAVVTTDQPGIIPQGGLVPPQLAGTPNSKLFAGQTFANIETWLKAAKVNFLWRKEETGTNWKTGTSAITEYDATKKKLWFALDNQSANLKLTLGNGLPDLDWNTRDNKNQPIEIKLDAPATININPNELIKINPFITGNTKILNVDTVNIEKKINEFKQSLGLGFEDAPLTIKIKVGNEAFYNYKDVAAELAKLEDDVANGIVVAQFEIDRSQPNGSKFELTSSSKGEQQIINDDGTIKVYINDKGIYTDLQATNPKGTSKALELEWKNGILIDPISGVLTATNPTRGKGLKIEYTFNKTLTGTEPTTGTDVNKQWVKEQPKTFTPGVDDKLLIRIRLVNDKYTYDNIDRKIEIDLTKIKSIITLDPKWLNQPVAPTEIDINSFEQAYVQTYEDKVFNAMTTGGINSTLKDKIEIKYAFNGQEDLDKTKLIESIKAYKAANATQDNLGILQLWNQTSGEKITAKFAIKEKDKPLYELEITGGADKNKHDLDTSNIFTTIEFDKVIKWLTETNKLVIVKGSPQSATFSIPQVNANGDIFNEKKWTEVEKILSLFGITVQYRQILDGNNPTENDWKNSLNDITKYDENIGKIGIRFKFDQTKSKNIKLKTGINASDIYNGKTIEATPEFKLSLNVKLTLKINQTFVDTFINGLNVISGNTKYLSIDNKQEQAMVQKIKTENETVNNEFTKAGLIVKYKLETQSEDKWNTLTEFTNDLATINTDQQSNKVMFKFEVNNKNDFAVDDTPRTLFNPDLETDHDNWKVKFFINDSNWETDASKIVVTGTTSGLNWKWSPLGVSESVDNKVGNNKLEVQFSAKPGAGYDDNDVDDNGDIKTKWTRTKPTQLDPTIQDLLIRLKAKAGYVYGPAYNQNGHSKTASVHKVNLQIKREILVNPKALSTNLSLPAGKQFVTDITKTDLEKFVNDGIGAIPTVGLEQYVTVKFNFNNRKGLTSEQLYQAIQSIITTNTAPNYGILQLWNGILGEKIHAYYELKDPKGEYVLITANNSSNPSEPQEIIVDHIATRINLKEIVNDLKNQKIHVESTTSKKNRTLIQIKNWIMPNIKGGTDALNGLNWEQFEQRLNQVGVFVEARVVNNPDQPQVGDWKPLKDLKQYDDTTLQLALRFRIDRQKAANIVLSVLTDDDVNIDGNILTSGEFKMNIKAPATVVVNPDYLTDFKDKYKISGDTKYITLDEASESDLIKKITDENVAVNPTVFQDLKERLFIEYYLGKNASTDDNDWRTTQDFKTFLSEQERDQETNKIWFRLNVKEPTEEDGQVFQIDKKPQILSEEKIDAQAKVKIYINETGFTNKIQELMAVGSTDDFSISGLLEWEQIIPKGLEVGYSNETDPKEEEDDKWTNTKPQTLNTDKKLWVRFKVEGGYKFEGAKTDNESYGPKHAINTSGIKVIIKLQKSWLEKIQISGNTKDAIITETNVINEIINNNVLPTSEKDLVELQYKIKSTNYEWVNKDEFTKKLKELAGSKDGQNFILRREELLVRFNIKNKNTAGGYGLNIDNQNINDSNRDNYNVQIVNDINSQNSDFEGYINLDKLTNFVKDNFHIIGSTSQPRLIINNRNQMNTMFAPYVSDGLFDILFSTVKNKDDSWDWNNTSQSILSSGQLIDENGLITQNITIGADKNFAIKFISKNQKYKVYKEGTAQNDGYILDLSDNVKITIEITNPFTDANKTLGIWTREDNKDAHYYQGQGGFKIVLADKNNLEVNPNSIESAEQFLQGSNLTTTEKEALELVFHNFGSSAPQEEIERVEKAIRNYNENTWQSFDSIKEKASGEWSQNLGLKVGDYVAVALRVKKEYAIKDDPFVLKGDDHSMILPVMSVNGVQKQPGRISGYKIKSDAIQIENGSLILTNPFSSQLPPLDGWTELQRLNLVKDELGNYLGANLSLQLYTDFHKDQKENILFSGSGANLVKRESGPNIETTGYYKDSSGQNIKDDQGKEIPIYKDKTTERLSAPIKNTTSKRNKSFTHLGDGIFRFPRATDIQEQALFSLFRNQAIDLKIEASVGQGTEALPDFYLDTTDEKLIDLEKEISPQIKFPVENENKISYGWNYEEFTADKIEYKHPSGSPDKNPEDGNAQLNTKFKLIKKQPGQTDQEITGDTIEEAVRKIEEQLKIDFQNQLKFQINYFDSKGGSIEKEGNDIYQFTELKNKDRIVLKIVAIADDLYYVNEQSPLVINVNGLTQAAPNQEKMQYLRVKQGGLIDGQGSFKVLVSNPDNSEEDEQEILKGWKFMIRVWDKNKDENGKPKVKIPWSDDPARINNLANGDKVEWKLVSSDGNPVKDAYYNTIALKHDQNSNGNINYQFGQVNYPNGQTSYEVVEKGIGAYPANDDQYPENSGFVISGLQPAFKVFKIDQPIFEKIIQELNPFYVGFDHQGTINFDNKYLESDYWVNTKGEIYLKEKSQVKLTNEIEELAEIPIKDFIDKITFFTQDPVLFPYQNGFKFSGNDVNISNNLANGNQVWAQFSMIAASDEGATVNTNENLDSITIKLADVSGLKNASDPMSPLWYVLMALAGILTLGTASLIAFLMTRHKKLKGK